MTEGGENGADRQREVRETEGGENGADRQREVRETKRRRMVVKWVGVDGMVSTVDGGLVCYFWGE